jgi:rubrerythrin
MRTGIVVFLLVFITGCSNRSLNRTSQTVTEPSKSIANAGDGTISKMEEDLAASLDQYFNNNASSNRPVIAATATELSHLKAAWASNGPEHDILAKRFRRADDAIAKGLSFPPEGGQHNQWYQCDSCQRGLVTIDAHHHKCPICGRIYSGFPYDNVLYNHRHGENIARAEDAAWAWAVTGERKYSDFAAAVLTGYAERYLKYPMLHTSVNDKTVDVEAGKNTKYITAGHLQSQTLDEANLMIPVTISYDLIYNSPSLAGQQKSDIENNFIRAMAECVNVYKSDKSNWQTWHNAALLYAGAVIGDENMIRQALTDKENGFTAQMKISIMPEGMWYENSWGYHYYTLSAMTRIAEGTRRLGFNVYNFPPLKKMYLIAFDYLMADGSLPRESV